MDSKLRLIADHLLALEHHSAVLPRGLKANLLPHFFVLDVERGAARANLRLRVRLAGTAVDQGLGRPVRGHCLEEFMHGPRSADVLAGFHNCAEKREPVWMRQVVRVKDRAPRFVEGIAVYIPEERIYGGLVFGEITVASHPPAFESAPLARNS